MTLQAVHKRAQEIKLKWRYEDASMIRAEIANMLNGKKK